MSSAKVFFIDFSLNFLTFDDPRFYHCYGWFLKFQSDNELCCRPVTSVILQTS